MESDHVENIIDQKCNYNKFIDSCFCAPTNVKLTPNSEASPYALCFAIFGYNLLKRHERLDNARQQLITALEGNLKSFLNGKTAEFITKDKPCLQLLTFTLSAFKILDYLDENPFPEIVEPLIPKDITAALTAYGVFDGKASSGNMAMFIGIILIHAKEYLGMDTQKQVEEWIDCHLKNMNDAGFWGKKEGNQYLLFQNGYHQYEILKYLNIENPKLEVAAEHIYRLADKDGHFAPYPGGGGCYDYDAISILCDNRLKENSEITALLKKSRAAILSEQNEDGGFCESVYVKRLDFSFYKKLFSHILLSPGSLRYERFRKSAPLIKRKNETIQTHWTNYSRRWTESDLWDSWFRMQAVAVIEKKLGLASAENWRFIDYPGIGYHA